MLPLPTEETRPQQPPVLPVMAMPFFEEDLATDWMSALSPAERDHAQRSGFMPAQHWERWRQRLTRESDGIL